MVLGRTRRSGSILGLGRTGEGGGGVSGAWVVPGLPDAPAGPGGPRRGDGLVPSAGADSQFQEEMSEDTFPWAQPWSPVPAHKAPRNHPVTQ